MAEEKTKNEPSANEEFASEENKIESAKKEVVEKTKKEIGKAMENVVKAVDEKRDVKHHDKKKSEAKVSVSNIPMSTKHSVAMCDFVRNKKIGKAISDVESVLAMKRAVPMKGEIPHRKGKGMMSGRFPQNAAGNFLKILRSLSANAVHNGLEDPVIVEAVANLGARPYGRRGIRRKRTHVTIKAMEARR